MGAAKMRFLRVWGGCEGVAGRRLSRRKSRRPGKWQALCASVSGTAALRLRSGQKAMA